jgi:hypothetical protein
MVGDAGGETATSDSRRKKPEASFEYHIPVEIVTFPL